MDKDRMEAVKSIQIAIDALIERGYERKQIGPALFVLGIKQAVDDEVSKEYIVQEVCSTYDQLIKTDKVDALLKDLSESLDPSDFLVFDRDTKTVKSVSHFSLNGDVIQINVECDEEA